MPGAMPFLHRWLGNPLFSLLVRRWFNARKINDVYCGLRGFTKAPCQRLDLRCVGMEFATEMIIKSSLFGEKVAEVPITLHRARVPDLYLELLRQRSRDEAEVVIAVQGS